MAFHHVAFGTKDLAATHRFYTETMGFRLVKIVTGPTEGGHGGWMKHAFYDTGDGRMIAFFDIHDDELGQSWKADHAASLGLPVWVNHIAFDSPSREDLAAKRTRWQEQGIEVLEMDHEWATSIYATDPNGIMVEFCCTTRQFTSAEVDEAARLLVDSRPPLGPPAPHKVHPPLRKASAAA